jgi:hypothetical protein
VLLARDDVGRNVFHVAAERDRQKVLGQLLEWAIEKLTTEEISNNLL